VGKAIRKIYNIDEATVIKRKKIGLSIQYFKKHELQVKSIYVRKDFTMIAVIEEGPDTFISDQKTGKMFRFASQKLKKALAKKPNADLIISYLFESGKLFILDSRLPYNAKYFKTKQKIIDFGFDGDYLCYIEEKEGLFLMREQTLNKKNKSINTESKLTCGTAFTNNSRILVSYEGNHKFLLNVKEFINDFGGGEYKQTDCSDYQKLNQVEFPASMFFNYESGKIELASAEDFDTKNFAVSNDDTEVLDTFSKKGEVQTEPNTESKVTEGNSLESLRAEQKDVVETMAEPTKVNEEIADKTIQEKIEVPEEKKEPIRAKKGALAIWTAGPLPVKVYDIITEYHKFHEPSEVEYDGDYHVFRKNECSVEKTMPTELSGVQFIIKTKGDPSI
jgi:hypothetical protein